MTNISNTQELSLEQREELLGLLKARFEKNMNRHQESGMGKSPSKTGS